MFIFEYILDTYQVFPSYEFTILSFANHYFVEYNFRVLLKCHFKVGPCHLEMESESLSISL